ncbi:hypothetical protein GCM10025868_04360 [Angustibacter aerolatus]|uniref:Uncharacterized protein n=1 Tax=Angustibacter aerolatus TaxID=1162965 RepID=A0ABQ6JC51_9ACTN|nr:hypothetical protein GCM10025868_04360 [Angustibacter aerolatus]
MICAGSLASVGFADGVAPPDALALGVALGEVVAVDPARTPRGRAAPSPLDVAVAVGFADPVGVADGEPDGVADPVDVVVGSGTPACSIASTGRKVRREERSMSLSLLLGQGAGQGDDDVPAALGGDLRLAHAAAVDALLDDVDRLLQAAGC